MATQLLEVAPGKDGDKRYKAEFSAIYASRNAELAGLLAYPLDPDLLQANFLSKMPFFFVRGNFSHLGRRIDPIFRALQAELKSPSLPSKPDITNLSNKGALSLFSILRMRVAFEYVRENVPSLSEVINGKDVPLIANGSVVPSLRHVDPKVLKQCMDESQTSEKELVTRMNTFLARIPNRNGGNLFPRHFFSSKLIQGEVLGKGMRTEGRKHFRITTASAMAICSALSGQNDLQALRNDADSLFPEDSNIGPGNGTYTVALPATYGNQIYVVS